MNANDDIIKTIRDNLNKNINFQFIFQLNDLTLSDIECIEATLSAKSKLNYKIVDKIYIKISYSTNEEEI